MFCCSYAPWSKMDDCDRGTYCYFFRPLLWTSSSAIAFEAAVLFAESGEDVYQHGSRPSLKPWTLNPDTQNREPLNSTKRLPPILHRRVRMEEWSALNLSLLCNSLHRPQTCAGAPSQVFSSNPPRPNLHSFWGIAYFIVGLRLS